MDKWLLKRKKTMDAIAQIREEEQFKVKTKKSKKKGVFWETKALKKEGVNGG